MPEFHALTIAAVQPITADAIAVSLRVPAALRETFRFKPGQHVAVRAMIEGVEQRRTYSICCGIDDADLRIAIQRVAGGVFAGYAHATFAAGQRLDVMPPSGRFVLPPSDGRPRRLVMLAAGSGITPIIAMVRQALEHEPGTQVTLAFGNRETARVMFAAELEDLKDRFLTRFQLIHVLSRNDEQDAALVQGRITGAKVAEFARALIRFDQVDHVFLCGPGSMIKDARTALFAAGVARDRVHHEFFAAGGGAYRAGAAPPAPAVAPVVDSGRHVGAVLDGVRHRFPVRPGEPVIDAALRAGVRAPYACKGGMCCTCRARIVEGRATMLQNYSLEPWEIEQGFVLTCQAVPDTDALVVDFDAM